MNTFNFWGPNDKREIVFEAGEMITDGREVQFVVFDNPNENVMALRKSFYDYPTNNAELAILWTPKWTYMSYGNMHAVTIYEGSIEPNGELLTINMRTLSYPDITKKTSVTISKFEFHELESKACQDAMRRLGL